MNYDYEATYLDSDSDSDSEAWSDYEGFDTFESFDTYDTYDSADSYGEARRKRPARPRPVRPAKGARLMPKRPAAGGQFVSQAAFAAAMAKVQQQVTTNGKAIQTVDGRVRTVISDTQKLQAQTRRSVDKLRSDLRTTQTLSALIPLLAPPGTAFGKIAPLAHLVMGGGGLPGQSGGQAGSGNPLGNTNNLVTVGALAFASGMFDK